jgi:hypothetical protein
VENGGEEKMRIEGETRRGADRKMMWRMERRRRCE